MARYPLSPMQQGMLFHSIDAPHSGVNVEHVLCRLAEPLDIPRFLGAWQRVIERHDVLRSAFDWELRSEPVQHVHAAVTLPAKIIDLEGLPESDRAHQVADLIAKDRAAGFDLRCAPLMRLLIVRHGANAFDVLWSFHHAILDGRSFPIVLREVFGIYDGLPIGAEPTPRPYAAYIEWLQSQAPERSKPFWEQRLGGITAPTPLLHSVLGGADEGIGTVDLTLTPAETTQVESCALETRCTVGTLLTAAWALLLARYTGEEDVVFGATRACRRSALGGGASDMVGVFINTVPFRARVTPDATVAEWLAEIRAEHLALRRHEHTPLTLAQSCSGVARGTPLFETLLVYENYLLDTLLRQQGGAWANRRFEYKGQTNYPVTLSAYGDVPILLRLEYDRRRLSDAAAARMVGHVRALLVGLSENPRRLVSDVPTVTQDERLELLPVSSSPSEFETFCLHERFERRAAETPDAPALTFEGRTLTYDALNRRANKLAHRLRALGVGPDVLVGVSVERSLELVIAILGVLKAGGAYVPLDPSYPAERLRFMLDDAHVALVVTAGQGDRVTVHGVDRVCIEDTAGERDANLEPIAEPQHLAYAMYTSGSTGTPKGVLVTHANVSRLFDSSETWFEFGRQDVWTLFHSYAFDFSVWEMWGALLYGGRLVVVPHWIARAPDAFIDLLERERVTVLNQTPSAFRQLIEADGERARAAEYALRFIVFGGEALEVGTLAPWFRRHGDAKPAVVNMFGITETTVHVTYRRITQADVDAGVGSVIGVPLADLDVYIVDRHRQLAPVGVPGEIYVGGAGVARGYLARPELTRARFVADSFRGTGSVLYRSGDVGRWLPSGELEYRGRIDDQVKIRGFRIELGEVEANVRRCPGVLDAAVVVWRAEGADNRLAAYVVLDAVTSPDAVRTALESKIPPYMIPAVIVPVEGLKLTSTGKLDRRALPSPSAPAGGDSYVAPRSEVERKLADIWTTVLRRDRIGINDNFFEQGGDSILCMQVVSRCRHAGLSVTTRDVFSHPTVASLAAIAAPAPSVPTDRTRASGHSAMTPVARWFFEQEFANPDHWNQAYVFEVPAALDVDVLERALNAVVGHHDAFRQRFYATEHGWEARYIDQCPAVTIERVDLSGVAAEIVGEAIQSKSTAVQASLDLLAGPTIRAVHFRCDGDRGRLLLAIHHVAVDMVSWRIVLEDLESAYLAIGAGRAVSIPPATTSPQTWAERLRVYADTRAKQALPSWTRAVDAEIGLVPRDHVGDRAWNTEASTCAVTTMLSPAETDAVVRRGAGVHGTQINDVLLTALGRTIAGWTGRSAVMVDVEGHGREDLFNDIDLSRTVGWFTSIYPVALEVSDTSPFRALERTREALRRVHDNGISYGALRYVASDERVRDAAAAVPEREVLFNYLGQVDAAVAGLSLFAFADEAPGDCRAGENRRSHLLEVLAEIRDGRLTIHWQYSSRFHEAATIADLASRYTDALRELIAQRPAADTAAVRLADCPDAALTEAEFDELAGRYPALVDVYPLSATQRLFYTMEVADGMLGFEQWDFLIEGPLDSERLRRAWDTVVARHAILRTAFARAGAAGPRQIVVAEAPIAWHEEDWRALGAEARDARIREYLAADRGRPFDLTKPPLMRIAILRTGDAAHRMVWSTHHLLVDGWSWPRIFADLARAYGESAQDADTSPSPCQYRDYVRWVDERNLPAEDQFWRAMLTGVTSATPLPGSGPRKGRDQAAATEYVSRRELTAAMSTRLVALARACQVTLGTLMQGAWGLVLAHHSGRPEVVFGAAFTGRAAEIPGIETMVGPCVNNLPVRLSVNPEAPLGEWLRGLNEQIGELTRFQTTPLERIHAACALPKWSRLFDSLVVVQNYTVDPGIERLGDAKIVPVACPESTNYPATVVVRPGARIEIKVVGLGHAFDRTAADVAATDLLTVLETMAVLDRPAIGELLAQLPAETRGASRVADGPRADRRRPQLAPRTNMEKALSDIWRDVLGCDIGTDENYFELGAHSLMLVHAHERICSAFKPDLPVSALFQYPTVRDLAAHLAGGVAAARGADVRARAERQQRAAAQRMAIAKRDRV
ncbi:MAG TPA: amino acid adenylation domain-containing protein [Vicinamibacterales bacterium]|nr:amino acid adenylation domain-containing protein [Vicinamibacterales bacterium]